ncbi:hypothetical protein NIES21_61220 (plasmid) [Anabaenopsis circularis NIES-21]|uniref:Uncharacterized protein n=1 Tax=Anabaenopsis circularis NIES-21 TaxID=1085406 RepID=A0A1Z4GRV7_9CYAN|nr:hypothetical protein NIES21_61220 [Anabaenopsis circularis NIES-21]
MEQGLAMLYETAMFSEKQVVAMTGFSRKRLYNLSVSEIVIPEKDPILYTWEQVVFLRVLYLLRQDWSLQVIEKQFRIADQTGIERLIERIHTSTALLFYETSNEYELSILEISILNEESSDPILVTALKKIKEGKTLNYNDTLVILSQLLKQPLKTDSSKIFFNKQTLIITPQLIRELIQVAGSLSTESDELKAS